MRRNLKRLLADVKEALGALEALDCPVHHWDYLIVFMVVRKLDPESLKDWEKILGAKTSPPIFDELETFLVGRIHVLEALERSTLSCKPGSTASTSRAAANTRSYSATTSEQQCALCNAGHYIASCPKYLKTPAQRRDVVISKTLCTNCLGPHQLKACRTWKRCRICRKQHHSTLHNFAPGETSATSVAPLAPVSSAAPIGTPSDGIPGPSQHARGPRPRRRSATSHSGAVCANRGKNYVTCKICNK